MTLSEIEVQLQCAGHEKVFLKGNLKSIAQELIDIEFWRNQNEQ